MAGNLQGREAGDDWQVSFRVRWRHGMTGRYHQEGEPCTHLTCDNVSKSSYFRKRRGILGSIPSHVTGVSVLVNSHVYYSCGLYPLTKIPPSSWWGRVGVYS